MKPTKQSKILWQFRFFYVFICNIYWKLQVDRIDITYISLLSYVQYKIRLLKGSAWTQSRLKSVTNSTEQRPILRNRRWFGWSRNSPQTEPESPWPHSGSRPLDTISNKGSPVHNFTPYSMRFTSVTSSKHGHFATCPFTLSFTATIFMRT